MTEQNLFKEIYGEHRDVFRELYGKYIDPHNLFMPMGHFIIHATTIFCNHVHYKGIPAIKFPCDAWVYHEIVFETGVEVIVEIGNQKGGSTLMLRDFGTHVIGVDIDHSQLDERVRNVEGITWIEGDAADPETFQRVKAAIPPDSRVMVIDDSAHNPEHTMKVLRLYNELVTPGCYFIVEDTDENYLIKRPNHREGPLSAVLQFVEENPNFVIDRTREKFWMTANPHGFLKRIK